MRALLSFLFIAVLAGCGTSSHAPPQKTATAGAAQHGYYKIGQPYEVDGVTYTPAEDWNYDETGIASWYGPNFHGKVTANGELYDMNQVTGAHKTLPMPSLVRVTNLDNGRMIIVRLNDRGPYSRGRILDLSRRGAQLLGYEKIGTAKVRVQILAKESQALAQAARQGQLTVDLAGIDPDQAPPPPPGTPSYVKPAGQAAAPTPPQQVAQVAVPVADEKAEIQQDVGKPAVQGQDIGGRFLPTPQITGTAKVKPSHIYIQAGAFSVQENAERLRKQLSRVAKADISPAIVGGRTFYRVRIGPIMSVDEADQTLSRVVAGGGGDAKIIVD